MASKRITKKPAPRALKFKATYSVLALTPPCTASRSCPLSLCGRPSIQCDAPSMVQLLVRSPRERREILEIVKEIRKLEPKLGIVITGKPGDIRRIESGLKGS